MDLPLPLRIHIGFDQELVIRNNALIGGLSRFDLSWTRGEPTPIITQESAGDSPMRTAMPDNALSNHVFPLRIYFDDVEGTNEACAWLLSRPLTHIKAVNITLHQDPELKRLLRLVFDKPLPDDVVEYLVGLGVEVVTDAPDFEGIEETTHGPTEIA